MLGQRACVAPADRRRGILPIPVIGITAAGDPRHEEDRRRNGELFEDRKTCFEIVEITVIERDHEEGLVQRSSALKEVEGVRERNRHGAAFEGGVQLATEGVGLDAQGIALCDSVIAEDSYPGRKAGVESAERTQEAKLIVDSPGPIVRASLKLEVLLAFVAARSLRIVVWLGSWILCRWRFALDAPRPWPLIRFRGAMNPRW